jgi:biotin operon repressor
MVHVGNGIYMVSEFKSCMDRVKATLKDRGIRFDMRVLHTAHCNKEALDDVLNGSMDHKGVHYKAVIEHAAALLKKNEARRFRADARRAVDHDFDIYYKLLNAANREGKGRDGQEIGMLNSIVKTGALESMKVDGEVCGFNISEADDKEITIKSDLKKETVKYSLTKRQRKILDLLKKDTAMTYVDLAKRTGRSRAAVSKDVARLKELGLLKRVGSDKTGHWVASLPSSKS